MDEAATPPERGGPPSAPARPGRSFPFAALLFAPASVLGLMARNLNQTKFADVAPALLGTMAFALLVWATVAMLRRHVDARTAVVACLWMLGCLFYLGLFGRLNAVLDGGYSMLRSLPFAVAALVAFTLVLLRLRQSLAAALHMVLSAVALVMVATPLWQAAAYEWRHGDARAAYDPDRAAAEMPEIAAAGVPGAAAASRPPDIYHFVFDRYGSADTLARHYGVEGSIGDFLQARGFYVAGDSYSNYLKTGHSLASTFYMDYLDILSDDPRVEGANWHPIFEMLGDHRVARFLDARGYEILQFGSWWVGTYRNAVADENHPYGFSEFDMLYLRRTILRPLFHLLPDTPLTMRLDWDNAQCQRVARQIDAIKAIGERPEPVYVFAHILVPHGPEVFTPEGRCLSREASAERGEFQGYIDQIAYADRIIREIVMHLQADDRTPPIILIQADEGPFPERDYRIPWQDASAEELRIKTGILNAFYFPGGDYRALRPDITPVNSFRAVLNTHFGTGFPQLPDRIFAFPNDARIFEFHDVTAHVRHGAGSAPQADTAPKTEPAREAPMQVE